jgi:purine-binding chemotaxis protein CheW
MSTQENIDKLDSAGDKAGQYATFQIDDQYFGIEVLRVQEVVRHLETTPVPMAPEVVRGLINLRGQIVTAVDVRLRLGLKPRENGADPMNVVVRSEDGAVSLLVDEIGDVVQVSAESYEPPPDSISRAMRGMIRGVHKLDGRLLLVLNTDQVLLTQG